MTPNRALLFDARLVLDKPTGIGQYISSLLPEMVEIAPDIHFHVLQRPDPWPGYLLSALNRSNVSHHVSQLRHISFRQHLYLPRLARSLQVDLLHYPHFDAPVHLSQVPVVATIHDLKYLVHPEYLPDLGHLKRRYMRLSFRQTVKWASAVIAVSRSTRDDLDRLFPPPNDNLHVVYEAADARFADSAQVHHINVQAKYGIVKPFILSVGEFRPHKNHAGLVAAYAESASVQSHDLVIIGQDHRNYRVPQTAAAALGVADRVHFLHDVDMDELASFYANAVLFILVSLYEGFGLPILEAGACGTPIIASNTTATGEIAGNGGLQVDPTDVHAIADAIDRVLQDGTLRQALATRSRQRAQEFSWRRAAQETVAIYRAVMEKHDGRAR